MGNVIQLRALCGDDMDVASVRPKGVDNIAGKHLIAAHDVGRIQVDEIGKPFQVSVPFRWLATSSTSSAHGLVISIQS